ncbi:MAG: hypothetical protein JNJ54_12260 [Myxococcaceae bacterium]|nr:hypothetical protein [Myxococcaceae bacterium]
MRRLRGLLPLLLLLLASPAGAADFSWTSLFSGTGRHGGSFYELGLTWGVGGLLHAQGAAPIGLTGVRVVQHQGFISQLILLALGRVGIALGAVDIQQESEFESVYDARTGKTYQREISRTTTFTQKKSEGEVKAELDDLDEGVSGLVTWIEATVYAPKVLGFGPAPSSSEGYELSLGVSFELAKLNHLPLVLSVGGGGANIRSPVTWTGTTSDVKELTLEHLGLLARLHVPLTRFADVALEWQPNVHTLTNLDKDASVTGVVAPSPLRAIAYLHLTNYLYVRGQVVLGGLGFSDGRLGYNLELGGRL